MRLVRAGDLLKKFEYEDRVLEAEDDDGAVSPLSRSVLAAFFARSVRREKRSSVVELPSRPVIKVSVGRSIFDCEADPVRERDRAGRVFVESVKNDFFPLSGSARNSLSFSAAF